jgi:hypothetical protein
VRALMALNRQQMSNPRRERQAIFLGATEPRAARPERPTAGLSIRLCRLGGCQCNGKGEPSIRIAPRGARQHFERGTSFW